MHVCTHFDFHSPPAFLVLSCFHAHSLHAGFAGSHLMSVCSQKTVDIDVQIPVRRRAYIHRDAQTHTQTNKNQELPSAYRTKEIFALSFRSLLPYREGLRVVFVRLGVSSWLTFIHLWFLYRPARLCTTIHVIVHNARQILHMQRLAFMVGHSLIGISCATCCLQNCLFGSLCAKSSSACCKSSSLRFVPRFAMIPRF